MSKLITKAMSLVLVLSMLAVSTGCYSHRHVVGGYSGMGTRQEFREWYVLWGIVPIVEKDAEVQAYVASTDSYAITWEFTPIDVIIGIFTGIVTIGPRTVAIEK